MKKFKGHFWSPSHPSVRPTRPSHQTQRFAPRRKGKYTGPRRDIVGILVLLHHFLYKPIKISRIHSKILNKMFIIKYLVKSLTYTHQKKSHVPALILKFLTTTPNLTSNFETWHQILKPIRILVKTLIICIGICIQYLCTLKV